MRIVLHAGLHKTGTTYVQASWLKTFKGSGPVWYPEVGEHGPSHAEIAWWILGLEDVPCTRPLPNVVRRARSDERDTLLLSGEDFSRLTDDAAQRLGAAVGDHDLTVLLTLTPPATRWPSLWQELVKHGHAGRQAESRELITKYTQLSRGALRALIERFPTRDVRVRLVRDEPAEPGLPEDLLRVADVAADDVELESDVNYRNASIGHTEAHLLRALNEFYPAGIDWGPGRGMLTALAAHPGWRENVPARRVQVEEQLCAYVSDLARQEALEIEALEAEGHISLADPHQLLRGWWLRPEERTYASMTP